MNRVQKKISGLYAIADRDFNPFDSLSELVRRYLEGGAGIVQLRMKDDKDVRRGTSDVGRNAEEIMKLKGEYDFIFIMNDHVDVALDVGADGVHVGENDEPIEDIRARTGGDFVIGYSSHSKGEAVGAQGRGADYVAFGAVFPTRTKGPGHPIQGLEGLAEVSRSLEIPLVAIGGIGRENIARVIEAGADAVAMITALSQADDVVEETRWFLKAIERLRMTKSQ